MRSSCTHSLVRQLARRSSLYKYCFATYIGRRADLYGSDDEAI